MRMRDVYRRTVFLVTICIVLTLRCTCALSIVYTHGPLQIALGTRLYFSVIDDSVVHIALAVDSNLKVHQAAWMGIGIGESTCGGMRGADVVTAEFAPNVTRECTLVDRHVPYVAYPLQIRKAVFPARDDISIDTWNLTACTRYSNGTMLLEVQHPIAVTDEQDRMIGTGLQRVVYAHGGKFGYHGTQRGSSAVDFFAKDAGQFTTPPSDATHQHDIKLTYSLNTRDPTFVCTSSVATLPAGNKSFMLVAAEASVNRAIVKRILVYGCERTAYFQKFVNASQPCRVAGPLPSIAGNAKCNTFLYACKLLMLAVTNLLIIPLLRSLCVWRELVAREFNNLDRLRPLPCLWFVRHVTQGRPALTRRDFQITLEC